MNKNITATILIVLAIGIYFTVTKGKLAEAGLVAAQNSQYTSAIDSAKQLIAVRDQVNNDYKEVSQDDRDKLAKMVPDSVDNIRLIIDMTGIAKKFDFTLSGLSATVSGKGSATSKAGAGSGPIANPMANPSMPGSTAASLAVPTLDTVAISFSVSAPFNQFVSFMQALEADLRIMDITHLTMTANDSGVYDFNVQMNTYWLRQQ